jgi:hypothetical protein
MAHGLVNLKRTELTPEFGTTIMKHFIPHGCEKQIKTWFELAEATKKSDFTEQMLNSTVFISPEVEYLVENKSVDGNSEYQVSFRKTSPFDKVSITMDERTLLDVILNRSVKCSELLEAYSRKKETRPEEFSFLLAGLLRKGILERQDSNR